VHTPIYDAVADSLGFDPARPDTSLKATVAQWGNNSIGTEDD
jgi:hypothetical protein